MGLCSYIKDIIVKDRKAFIAIFIQISILAPVVIKASVV